MPRVFSQSFIDHQWKKGVGGGGRRPHSAALIKAQLESTFLECIRKSFNGEGLDGNTLGEEAIERVRRIDPTNYLRIIASLMPKDVEVKRPLSDMTDDDITSAIEYVQLAIAGNLGSIEDGSAPEEGGESAFDVSAIHEAT